MRGPGACPALPGPPGAGPGPHLALGPAVLSDRAVSPACHPGPQPERDIHRSPSGGQRNTCLLLVCRCRRCPPRQGADADGRRLVLTCSGRRRPRRRRPGLPPLLAQRERRARSAAHRFHWRRPPPAFCRETRGGERGRGRGESWACPPRPRAEGALGAAGGGQRWAPHPTARREPLLCATPAGTWGRLLPAVPTSLSPAAAGTPLPTVPQCPQGSPPLLFKH